MPNPVPLIARVCLRTGHTATCLGPRFIYLAVFPLEFGHVKVRIFACLGNAAKQKTKFSSGEKFFALVHFLSAEVYIHRAVGVSQG